MWSGKKYKSKCKIHKIWPITLVSDGTDCAEASGYVSRNPVLGIKWLNKAVFIHIAMCSLKRELDYRDCAEGFATCLHIIPFKSQDDISGPRDQGSEYPELR